MIRYSRIEYHFLYEKQKSVEQFKSIIKNFIPNPVFIFAGAEENHELLFKNQSACKSSFKDYSNEEL